MSNNLRNSALLYAEFGLQVVPLKPGKKTPAFKGWREAATTDKATISSWWDANPFYNVGVVTGDISRLLVVDYDAAGGKRGLLIRDELAAGLPDTWTARTAHGGIHEFYHTDMPGRNRAGLYGCVDTRGEGGFVVAPPSVVDGLPYSWLKPPVMFQLADVDENVWRFISPAPKNEATRNEPYRVPAEITEGGRTSALVALAGSLVGKGLTPEAAEAAIREENERRCFPPLTDEELEREVFPSIRRPGWQHDLAPYTRDLPIDVELIDKLRALDPANSKKYGMNDAGSARLFMDTCGNRVQYAADRRKWLFYDGRRWDADGENAVKERLKQLADALSIYALRHVNDDRRAAFLQWAAKWQQLHTRQTILQDAQSIRPVKSDIFDRLPLVLNCMNGTLNLETGDFREHRAEDMLSRIAAVSYDPTATSPRWLRFIDEITAGDKETAQYIQKAAGYALTGDTRYECLFVCYGATSRNGKSTLLETLSAALGDYAATANPETFTKSARANDNSPSEDIARLAGVRFVTVSEPPRGMELNSALVKTLTGRDSVKARRLYESSFEYVPQFKLFFNTNHRPRVDDMTVFESERIKLIPFTVHFGQDRRDTHLKDVLQAPESLAGVLNWALEGLRLLHTDGFTMPAAVVQATEDYRRKQDKLLQFLEERTVSGEGETPLKELHDAFGNWCSASGLIPVSLPRFKELLEERQIYTKKKRPNGTGRAGKTLIYVLGLRLLDER